MVEVFGATGRVICSVTQQFNTTTSMGRLMLNVLLSFAQFEREVTGERITTRLLHPSAKGCGWVAFHRLATTLKIAAWYPTAANPNSSGSSLNAS